MFESNNKPALNKATMNSKSDKISKIATLTGEDSMRIHGGYCIHKITEGPNEGKFQIIWSGTAVSGTTVSEELFDFYDEARKNAEFFASISNDAYEWDTCGRQLTVDENGYLEDNNEEEEYAYSISGFTPRTSEERKIFKNAFGSQFGTE